MRILLFRLISRRSLFARQSLSAAAWIRSLEKMGRIGYFESGRLIRSMGGAWSLTIQGTLKRKKFREGALSLKE